LYIEDSCVVYLDALCFNIFTSRVFSIHFPSQVFVTMYFFALFVVSSTQAVTPSTVYNLTMTPVGLTIPCRSEPGEQHSNHRLFDQCIVDSTQDDESIPVDRIQNIPDHVQVVTDSIPNRRLSISLRSDFGDVHDNIMILPSSVDNTFRMITNVVDPREYCVDGSIGMTSMALPVAFNTRVSLGYISQEAIMETRNGPAGLFYLSTIHEKDVIPQEVYDALIDDLERLSGVRNLNEMDFENLMPRMPSLIYQVYRDFGFDADEDRVASIVLQPEDYVVRSAAHGRYELQVEPGTESTWRLGLKFLKNVGFFIDYQYLYAGLCEPLYISDQ